jgi:hypothetical protein
VLLNGRAVEAAFMTEKTRRDIYIAIISSVTASIMLCHPSGANRRQSACS